jgi:UDP-N-acetylmuramate: L-alanyl-gamma-D-glutamyl-meso-diaminopimelate ligase
MNIHMTAICGMGMGSLAQLLTAGGHRVSGSDANPYPPMSTLLERIGIEVREGFAPEHISSDTELVIIGNAARSDNPEVLETFRRGLRYLSFPQALEEMYLKQRMNVVVAGTHGKTTTCALVAWILHHAGLEPGFLIGGVLRNFDASSAPGSGPHFVVEGDEYHAAFFDRAPKFMHYRPHVGVLTSVDFDHADIFSGLPACKEAFARFASLIPVGGPLIACGDDPHVRDICAGTRTAPIERYGFSEGVHWRIAGYRPSAEGSEFTIVHEGRETFPVRSPLAGRHNALNTAAAFVAAHALGVAPERITAALERFQGVKRRQEVRGEVGGVTVIDDFAHHPTEVSETIAAVRDRYRGRRLWAVWEPRTNSSRRNFFQTDYPAAFAGADRVVVAGVYHSEQIEPERRFSPEKLASDLRGRGINGRSIERVDDILGMLLKELVQGDVALIMSNGAFGGIHGRLLDGLRERRQTREAGASDGLHA